MLQVRGLLLSMVATLQGSDRGTRREAAATHACGLVPLWAIGRPWPQSRPSKTALKRDQQAPSAMHVCTQCTGFWKAVPSKVHRPLSRLSVPEDVTWTGAGRALRLREPQTGTGSREQGASLTGAPVPSAARAGTVPPGRATALASAPVWGSGIGLGQSGDASALDFLIQGVSLQSFSFFPNGTRTSHLLSAVRPPNLAGLGRMPGVASEMQPLRASVSPGAGWGHGHVCPRADAADVARRALSPPPRDCEWLGDPWEVPAPADSRPRGLPGVRARGLRAGGLRAGGEPEPPASGPASQAPRPPPARFCPPCGHARPSS